MGRCEFDAEGAIEGILARDLGKERSSGVDYRPPDDWDSGNITRTPNAKLRPSGVV